MRTGLWKGALCALLMSGVAGAAEEMGTSAPAEAPAAMEPAAEARGERPAGGDFERMPPGAEPLPAPLAEEAAVALPEGSGTNVESPAEDRAADEAPQGRPAGAAVAEGEDGRI